MRGFEWYSDDLRDLLRSWPIDVRRDLGHQIREVQAAGFPVGAKWWKDVGPGVVQLKAKGFRIIVTIAIEDTLVVVHAFAKDSSRGAATRKQHKELVRKRVAELIARSQRDSKKH